MQMKAKDLDILEYPAVLEIISGFCTFENSRKLALSMLPSDDIKIVESRLALSAQARALMMVERTISLSDLEDVSAEICAASRGMTLDGLTLARVRLSMEVLKLFKSSLMPHQNLAPLLVAMGSAIGDFSSIIDLSKKTISPTGEVLPNASRKLTELRSRSHDVRRTIISTLQTFVNDDHEKRYIQDSIITEREGRFVVAVKNEHRRDVAGIVHDVSNTGATVFIEPLQTLEIGNILKELQIEETREIERILSELSHSVGECLFMYQTSIEAAAAIDFELAKGRYARRCGATEANVYDATEAGMSVSLCGARHPLLGADAVPLDLEIGQDFRILMITGPNTGGKTVALKTIGLLSLMTQAGLPIPASERTRLPVFSGVYADIGDEQAISDAMSTFGWHMSNISRVLADICGPSLVLLDELGASTDPQEGAALGRAIIQHLLEKNVLGVITTHYSELKMFAHSTSGLQNASFSFDAKTYRPTYRLTLGTPGGSNAIATAAYFALPPSVIAMAKEQLSQDKVQMESLLIDLQKERTRLVSLTDELESQKNRQKTNADNLEKQLVAFNKEKNALLQDTRDTLVREFAELQKEIKQAKALLRKDRSREAVERAQVTAGQTQERLRQRLHTTDGQEEDAEQEIARGDCVMLMSYEIVADVVSIDKRAGTLQASSGALTFTVPLSEAKKIEKSTRDAHSRKKFTTQRETASELDLRGKRAGEVEQLLDQYLSDAALSGRRFVRVIHGYGTGTVRNIVRSMLAEHSLVKSSQPALANEGGDGATNVELR